MNNDILQLMKDADAGKEQVPLQIKYKAMADDPFRFFRGSCGVFYKELTDQYPFPASPVVWACGDLHIENFGSYKSGKRLVYFDLNDFDEALQAPALWEICRLAVSVQLAAEETGFDVNERAQLVGTLLHSYQHTLKKARSVVIERETARGLIKKLVNKVVDRKESDLVKKRTDKENPDKLLVNDRLLLVGKEEKKPLIRAFNQWLSDNGHTIAATDAGFRIAGTGSLGVKRYLLLLSNKNNSEKRLLIDIKQALPSLAARYCMDTVQPVWKNQAERIIAAQETMQHVTPAFLSCFEYNQNWFVVKDLQPTTDKVNLSLAVDRPSHIQGYLTDLGILTASAQLRGSGRMNAANAETLRQFGKDGTWPGIVQDWSAAAAEQVKKDYAVYKTAWKDGHFGIKNKG